MKWNFILYACICCVLILLGVWVSDGNNIYTKDKREIVTTSVDPIFGTPVEKREFVDDFQLGLLPGDDESVINAFKSVSVPSALLCSLAIYSIFMIIREKQIRKREEMRHHAKQQEHHKHHSHVHHNHAQH